MLRSHLCSLALPLPRSNPLPRWSVIRDCALARLGVLPGAAPTLALPGPSCHVQAVLRKGDVVPARGLVGRVAGLASRALAPRPIHGRVRSLPRLITLPSAHVRSQRSQSRSSGRYRGRWVRSRSRRERSRSSSRHRFRHDRSQSQKRSLLSSDRSRSREKSWRPRRSRRDRVEAHGSSQDRGNSELLVEFAPAVAGSSFPQPKPSLQDFARLFLSLSGSREQWDVVVGSAFLAATGSGAGSLSDPTAPVPVAAPSTCSSVSVPSVGGDSPAGAASTTGSAGRRKLSRESSHSERHHRHSSSGERSHSSKKRHGDQSPSPACSSRLASASSSSLSTSSVADVPECVMPSPLAGRSGAGGGRSERDHSAAGHDHTPHPGPSGLGLDSRSSPVAGSSCSGDGGRSSPSPLGAGDDDRSSTVNSLNLDQDDSFRAVLRLIREFHSLEEPASVAPNWCKTSLTPVFRLQSVFPRLSTCLLPLS